MQGFDLRHLSIVVSDRQLIAMLGNSMSVDVLKMILGAVLPALTPYAEPTRVNSKADAQTHKMQTTQRCRRLWEPRLQ